MQETGRYSDEYPVKSSVISLQPTRRKQRLNHEHRILLLTLAAALPSTILALVLLWNGPHSAHLAWTITIFVCIWLLSFAFSVKEKVVYPLQTVANLLGAVREGDFSLRARGARRDDALGDVLLEVNMLGNTLREQRLGALEATTLLRKVMEEIDIAVFAFDPEHRLRLVNRAGEQLLGQPNERLLGKTAEELGLAELLEGEPARTLQMRFPGRPGRWGLRRTNFREQGRPHQLLVISDLSRALREEERQAWQRLIRVIGHELNNSLAPIMSIAGSLAMLLGREPRPSDWDEDMKAGLLIIASRAESLSRFTRSYAQLARLPQPKFEPINLSELLRRVSNLETRMQIAVANGPELQIRGDSDQLEQLMINLLRNAVDASLETGGGVKLTWRRNRSHVEVLVEDEGPGLSNTSNLFVPFFTTKPGGSGIGLVLSRQIAEAHGGSLALENRRDRSGCEARLRLPL